MSKGGIGSILTIAADVLAVATGNPEFIPLINAGIGTVSGLAQGESFGKALGQGAISGGEAFLGQEAAGLVGIGQGNTAFNEALGLNIAPSATGLPNIGGFFDDVGTKALGGVKSLFGLSAEEGGASGAVDASQVGKASLVTPGGSTAGSSGSILSPGQATGVGEQAVSSQFSPGSIAGEFTGSTPQLGSVTGGFADAGGFKDTLSAPFAESFGGGASAAAPAASNFFSLDTLKKSAIPLGNLAYQAIKGPPQLPDSMNALKAGGGVTGPLLAAEKAGLGEAESGVLSPAEQANITQFIQQSQNQLIQQLASQGVTDFKSDSRYISGLQDIQQKALAYQQQYIQQAFQNGFSAAGAASNNLATVANAQLQADQDFQSALMNAFSALGSQMGGTG